ncbi:DUF6134 family protein [Phenylobacterium sp.]|uniref:DUF6134 family protein n=1 Tax=Phenylobacterium sp. TaxID=1871053 RepID=UPI0039187FE5
MDDVAALSRRGFLLGLAAALPAPAFAAPAPLAFTAYRNGAKIGEHRVTFIAEGGERTAVVEADMVVKLGPVPVFRYRHEASERWRAGRFAQLRAFTNGNGQKQRVSAEALADAVAIEAPSGRRTAPAGASPLSHWNTAAFAGPLFNPTDGKLLRVTVRRMSPGHWAIRGEAEIDDFYDEAGTWRALTGRLWDGSKIEYRRT